jgi:hypothetical protein
LYRSPGTIPSLARDVFGAEQLHGGSAVPGKQPKFQYENVMGGLYLGIAVTGVEALVAMGLVIAFM